MRELNPLIGPLLDADPHRPRFVGYTADGGRTELSSVSLTNWAAKVAGLLRDEIGARPGGRAFVALGAGWQTAPILLGTWWAGLSVCDDDDPGAAAAFVPDAADPSLGAADFVPNGTDAGLGAADEVFVVSGHPLGAPSRIVAAHQRDFTGAVLPQADRFTPSVPLDLQGPAISGSVDLTAAAAVELAARTAALVGGEARILSTLPWSLPAAAALLLGSLKADGCLIQTAPEPEATLISRAAAEKATVTVGFDLPGLPRADVESLLPGW